MPVAVVALANFLFIVAFQSWLVNPPDGEIQDEPYILDPSELEFIDTEDESGIPWKDTILIIKIVCLVSIAIHQLVYMKQENEEVDAILTKCHEDHESIMEIPKFYNNTQKIFGVLEAKSKSINSRLRNAEKKTNNTKGYDKAKEDLEFVRESWFQQFSAYSLLDLELDESLITDKEFKMQLEFIKEGFDKEFGNVERYMEEDKLSLEEVTRDTMIMQNYFRSKRML